MCRNLPNISLARRSPSTCRCTPHHAAHGADSRVRIHVEAGRQPCTSSICARIRLNMSVAGMWCSAWIWNNSPNSLVNHDPSFRTPFVMHCSCSSQMVQVHNHGLLFLDNGSSPLKSCSPLLWAVVWCYCCITIPRCKNWTSSQSHKLLSASKCFLFKQFLRLICILHMNSIWKMCHLLSFWTEL